MNDPKLHLDDVIDRIVDGGLSPRELHEAVARLDASPDHWRRCALAFIEAQTLGEVLREPDERRIPVGDVIPFRRRAIAARRFAYAASLAVVAFGMGWAGHGVRLGTGPVPVSTTRVLGAGLTTPPELSVGARSVSDGPIDRSLTLPAPKDQSLGAGLTTPPEPTTEGLHAGEQIEIPLEDWLRNQPPPISPYEQAALEREGYRVEQHREVVLGTLDDGRLAALPVDQVQVEYVGHLPL